MKAEHPLLHPNAGHNKAFLFIISEIYVSPTPLHSPLPLITHTFLTATCQLRNLVVFHVSCNSAHILYYTETHV